MKLLLVAVCAVAVYGFSLLLAHYLGTTGSQEAFRVGSFAFNWFYTGMLGMVMLCGVLVAKLKA